jgi:hypothetical protein
MGIKLNACCAVTGVGLMVGFASLMAAGIIDKKAIPDPFYKEIRCYESGVALKLTLFSLPPTMVPAGLPPGKIKTTPPFGLYGSIMNSSQECVNPNKAEVITKKKDFISTFYLPNLTTWQWGVSEKDVSSGKYNGDYINVAKITLKDDYVLPAESKGSASTETVAAASLESLSGLLAAAHLTGFAPLYLKTVARAKSCATLNLNLKKVAEFFGFSTCQEKEKTSWCGVLGGNCLTPMMPGMDVWIPGLCSFTRTICRFGPNAEAEMKALVNPVHLNVTTIPLPCQGHTGFPPSLTCPLPMPTPPSADMGVVGLNATGHQQQVPGLVDGPYADAEDRTEIDDAESAIELATNLMIAVGAIGMCLSLCLIVWMVFRITRKTPSAAPESYSVAAPTILTSETQQTKEKVGEVSV